ncbi:MAG: hypothetical protein JWQ38_325 [Flavipsychrobacter sp.]|nr:hypothetical protein [Flavipsychrobacter sp.]
MYNHYTRKRKELNACPCAGLLFFIAVLVCSINSVAQSPTTRIITTVVGTGTTGYSGDGSPATAARLDSPACIVMDLSDNLYISDQRNSCVRKIDGSGNISTVAGTGTAGYSGDGKAATTAKMSLNWGVARDVSGNMYITDQVNFRVRKVNPSGVISTFAGTGTAGFYGDAGPATAAKFQSPLGIAVDIAGNVYVGDPNNFRVRKISTSGIVTTIAGNGNYGISGDNVPATATPLGYIWGLAIDAGGNLFICDGTNSCVHKVNTAGIMTTIAGTGTAGYSGDGGPATSAMLDQPLGVYVHGSGTIYIADYHNNRIRKIDPSGIITTVAGTGVKGYNGDNIPATDAQLFHPVSVLLDHIGDIYITDLDNVRIRKIKTVKTLSFTGGRIQNLDICQNTTTFVTDTLLTIVDHNAGQIDTWNVTQHPLHGIIGSVYSSVATGGKDMPSGFDYTPDPGYIGIDSFKVAITDGALSDTTTIYLTITTAPSAGIISGDDYVCVRSTIQLSESVSGGTWSTVNMHAVVTNGKVIGATSGPDTVIYTVTNACGSDVASKALIVRALPDAGIITGAAAFCNLSSTQLHDEVAGGTWSSTNTTVAVVDSGLVSGLLPGTAVIRYSVADSFCTGTTGFIITIDAYPDAGKIIGPPGICIGATVILAETSTAGTWKTLVGYASVSADGSTTGKLVGIDTISYIITNSCGTATAIHPIAVASLPGIPVIERKGDTCSVPQGYYSYQWLLNQKEIPGTTSRIYNVTAPGNYVVIVTNEEGCAIASPSLYFPGCSVADLTIFPNPATSEIHVSWCEKTTLKLACMDGKEVKVAENTNMMEIEDLPNGIYLLNVYNTYGDKVMTKRITKLSPYER